MTDRPVIIVGLDDSPTSRRALKWALGEAERLSGAIETVTTYHESDGADARGRAQGMQNRVIHEVVGAGPIPQLEQFVLPGEPVDVLPCCPGTPTFSCSAGTAPPACGTARRARPRNKSRGWPTAPSRSCPDHRFCPRGRLAGLSQRGLAAARLLPRIEASKVEIHAWTKATAVPVITLI